jgi:hypothetical protein
VKEEEFLMGDKNPKKKKKEKKKVEKSAAAPSLKTTADKKPK